MRVRDPEILAGALIATLVLLLVVPAVLVEAAVFEIPRPAWLALYALMFVSMMTSQWFAEILPRRYRLLALGTMVTSTWLVVATAPNLGYLPIVAVVSVAVCAYYLPSAWVRSVAVLNTAVIVGAQWAVDASASTLVFAGVVYLVLQLATVMSIDSQLREERTRHELLATNAELRATRVLLEESSRTQERLRIARELHDVLGHQLTGLILELEVASHHVDGEAREHVVKARGIARDLMQDVREAVGTQRELAPDLNGALTAITTGQPGLQVHLDVDEGVSPDPATTMALVRCTQEIVTNTLRHARAGVLWIDVGLEGGEIRLEAHDDGVGAATWTLGHGLRGMSERIEGLGGSVSFEPSDGFGVRLCVPAGASP
ncbi:sensor histidine kinase [Aeromicrobium sp. CF4.19]|uniref:sensor histidine kinase n=1 Tax=Aeromicrobium sp. CF4.19 TaxID=3373082 RepID=UPI003EE47745